MKKITIILIAFMYVTLANAQEFKSVKKDLLKSNFISTHKTYKKVRELIYVQDSSKWFSFNEDIDEWEPKYKSKVTQRLPNGKSKETISSKVISSEWINRYKVELFYDDSYICSNPFGVDAFLLNVWNSNTLSWQTDTLAFLNLTQYTDFWNFFGFGLVQEDMFIDKQWDFNTNQYTGGDRTIITLHDDSLYSDLLFASYDVSSQVWNNNEKEYIFDFNDNNNYNHIIEKRWDAGSSSLINYSQLFLAYSENNIIQRTAQIWDGVIWENSNRTILTYDSNNNGTSKISYSWDEVNLEWKSNYKTEYTYDLNNNKLSDANFSWSSSEEDWVIEDSTYYSYDVNNNMLTRILKEWDNTEHEWNFIEKNEYTFDINNNKLSETYFDWDTSLNQWVYNSRTIYNYNEFNSLVLQDNQYWSADAWVNNDRTVYNYDLNQNLEEKLHQNWSSGDWVNIDKEEYYWNEFDATIIEGVQNSYFNIYPNPTSDIVNVNNSKNNISSISITNVAGKVVYKNNKLNSKNNFINMKKYGNGIYLIKIKDVNGNEINSKILVK